MARIRTIKPEFWASPSTAKASAVARLAFIAMWNWADDHGRGTANLKELEGFIFPNDDVVELSHGKSAHFRSVVAEVATCFDVQFYLSENRPYYAIPSWDEHQRNERRSTSSKHPEPTAIPAFSWLVAETPSQATVDPNISGPGTGEQGNRGTGEQTSSSKIAGAIVDKQRPEVEALCERLASAIEANGSARPSITKGWRDAARLMLDKDHRTAEQIAWIIDWCQRDEFWRANVLSMPTLRKQFDKMRLRAVPESSATPKHDPDWALA